MTHDGDKLARAWMRAAETMPRLLAGRTMLLLFGGGRRQHYATFGHLAHRAGAGCAALTCL